MGKVDEDQENKKILLDKIIIIIIIMVMPKVKRIVTNGNLREKVYNRVMDIVLNNHIPEGTKIDENLLSQDLGVSKTPIREALLRLAHDGLVKIIPNRGAYKLKLFKEDILEIMYIGEVLEALCIRLAVGNINDGVIRKLRAILDDFNENDFEKNFSRYPKGHTKFFKIIYDTAKSPRLVRLIQNLHDLTRWLRFWYYTGPERVRFALEKQRELVDALEKRDAELAEKIRGEWIRLVFETRLSEMASGNNISYLDR